MGFGYRKRKKLAPGVHLNIGKRGLGLSFGPKGAKLAINSRGRRSGSLSWKGFFWRKKL